MSTGLMLWFAFLVLQVPEPGAMPGPNTGFVPPPPQDKRAKVFEPASQPDTYVTPNGKAKPGESDPKAKSPEEFGYQLIRKKDPFAAYTVFDEILRTNPNDAGAKAGKATALYEMARMYQRKGRMDEAKKAYEEAVATIPSLQTDEEFLWHREMLIPTAPKVKPVNVYDPRPPILQRPWIGPHLRFGAQGLVAPGLSIQAAEFLRVEAGADPIFAGVSAQVVLHFPWQWTPYVAVGGKLSFLYSPIGNTMRRPNYEIWQASFVSLGVGVQYRHPMGLFFTLGIDGLLTGGTIGPSTVDPSTGVSSKDIFYRYPFPQVTFGWLFGG